MDLYLPPRPAIILPHKRVERAERANFLPGWTPCASAAKAPHAEWVNVSFDSGNATGKTHNNVPLGTQASGRWIVLIQYGGGFLASGTNTNNLTVDGAAGTKILDIAGGNRTIWMIKKPTGTLATVAYSCASGTMFYGGLWIFAVYDLKAAPSVDTFSGATLGLTGLSDTANMPAKGCWIGMAIEKGGGSPTWTWGGGPTEQANGALSGTGANERWSAALANEQAANASYTVTASETVSALKLFQGVSLR